VQDFEPPKEKFMGNVERVKDIQEVEIVELVEDGAFALYVPNSDQPYKRYASVEDWIDGYAEMVGRITASQKYSLEEKADKLTSLAECNKVVTENFSTMDKVKLKGAIVESGGTVSPKLDKSQQPPDMGLNEQTF
jgi:hypothetical protein